MDRHANGRGGGGDMTVKALWGIGGLDAMVGRRPRRGWSAESGESDVLWS